MGYYTHAETTTSETNMTILLQKARRLEDDAEFAWVDGDEEKGERLDKEVFALWEENEARLTKAKTRLETFSEEYQDSGLLNAAQTTPWSCRQDSGKYCEFWELAADSAQCLKDCE